MDTILNISQIVIAALLIAFVLLQNRGSSAGSIFGGGGGGEGNAYTTKRGTERFLFIATIVLSILFMGVALVNILI
ncbi:preprotein translocase subunit SecG [Patescibacteria group bacterium]